MVAPKRVLNALQKYREHCEELAVKLDALEAIGLTGGYSADQARDAAESAKACVGELSENQLTLDDLYAFVEDGDKMPRFDPDSYVEELKGEVMTRLRQTQKAYHAILETISG